jgi:hypothetical protein
LTQDNFDGDALDIYLKAMWGSQIATVHMRPRRW